MMDIGCWRLWRSRLGYFVPPIARPFVLVFPAIAHKSEEPGGHGDPQAGKTVEESATQNIGAEEAPARPEKRGRQRPARAFVFLFLEKSVGERVDFGHVMAHVAEGVVMQ